MGALDTLLATQQAPDLLGAFNQGIQNRNKNALQALQLQQAPIVSQQQQQTFNQQQQLGQQRTGLNKQQSQLNEQKINRDQEALNNQKVLRMAALIGDITDPAQLEQALRSDSTLDEETITNAISMGGDAVRQIADSIRNKNIGQKRVQSSNILEDGTVQLVFNDGSVKIVSASDAGKSIIDDAQKVGIKNQKDRSAARESGKLGSQLELKPEVETAVLNAVSFAKEQFKIAGQKRSNSTALNVYNTAVKGLTDALSGTITGPVVGRGPAFTANQQIAQGAVAAMGPVLKQIFRGAGEGTFTDKDQELLLDMVPTRKDEAAARDAKLKNIDAIVRAKLTVPDIEPIGQKPQPQDLGASQPAQPQEAPLSAQEQAELQQLRALKAQQSGR